MRSELGAGGRGNYIKYGAEISWRVMEHYVAARRPQKTRCFSRVFFCGQYDFVTCGYALFCVVNFLFLGNDTPFFSRAGKTLLLWAGGGMWLALFVVPLGAAGVLGRTP